MVLATAPSAAAIESVIGGLGDDGEVIAVDVPSREVKVDVAGLIGKRGAVRAWGSGHAVDSEDTLEFSALRDVTPRVETFGLDTVEAAYDRMIANEAWFRVVLEP